MSLQDSVNLGQVGSLNLSFSGGKASAIVNVAVPGAGLSVGLNVQIDAGVLIDELKSAIDKAIPASVTIDEAIFGVLKSVVLAI